ncbi:hypothetical protein JYB88_09710 [Shewanella cyperi]|uniref:Uncharacterized protein n=1 Tax=Shewanella cyperi TaxID=2814292 RepID=A0A975AJW4_9GAMM|nr:hypothetical protein [Shewanella cyperi]QSX28578.1 hypothetical protein JYB88_09710 [Shewanella cyperi]
MQFDPYASSQSKVTTQILMAHAIHLSRSQKQLALELETTDSRISEWKIGKGFMPTKTAQLLIDKFGLPSKAKGEFKSNCKRLPKEMSLASYLSDLTCFQASRLIAGYLTHMRCIVIPDRDNNLEPSIEDHEIEQLLEDEQFLTLAQALLQTHESKTRHWTESDEFILNDKDLALNISLQEEEVSLKALLKKYHLEYLLEPKEYPYLQSRKRPSPNELITFLAYISIVINDLKRIPATFVSNWLGSHDYLDISEDRGADVVLTGEMIHDWYEQQLLQGLPIFNKPEMEPLGNVHCLIKHLNQLKKWVRSYRESMEHGLANLMHKQTPIIGQFGSSQEECPLVTVKELQVFHKEEHSYLTMAITIAPHQSIMQKYKFEEFNLILEQVTSHQLLDEIIPMLGSLGLGDILSDLNTKHKLAKHGLVIPGAISI